MWDFFEYFVFDEHNVVGAGASKCSAYILLSILHRKLVFWPEIKQKKGKLQMFYVSLCTWHKAFLVAGAVEATQDLPSVMRPTAHTFWLT